MMHRKWKIGIAVAMIVAVAAARPAAAQFDSGIAVGTKAPLLTISDLDGVPVNLGAYLGKKPVMLEFWATWCPKCEALLPQVAAVRKRFGDRIELIGINVTVHDAKERVRRYLAKHQPAYRTLWDDQGASSRAYEVPGTSFVVIVDRTGVVAYTGIGEDQDLVAAVSRVVEGKGR